MENDKKTGALTIGLLARAAGVGVPTVRYYQRRGLIREPPRPPSGRFRRYSEQDLARLLMIRHSKELGFTLAEIAQLIAHVEDEDCSAFRKLARDKLEAVEKQLRVLNKRKGALKTLLKECSSECPSDCPLYKRFMKSGRKVKY